MPTPHWRAGIDRRTLIKTGAALAVAQFASPFVIRARAADAVKHRPRQSADRHLRRPRQERADRLPDGARRDQRQGRHPRPSGRARGRGFDQRRRRHGGAEGAQADRRRQGRFPARQRQLGARARHGAGLERKGHPAHRARRPHRRDHRRELPLERVPRLQHHADGGERRRRPRWSRTTARSSTTSRPTTPSATRWRAAWSRRSARWAARGSAAT